MGLVDRITHSKSRPKRTIAASRLINKDLKQALSKNSIYLDPNFLASIPEAEQEKILTEIFSNYPKDPDIRHWNNENCCFSRARLDIRKRM
jgi:hypothetical protein